MLAHSQAMWSTSWHPRENQHSASATVCVHVTHDAPPEPQRIRLNGRYQTRKRAQESVCSFLTCTWNSSAVWFSSAAGVSSSCSVRIYSISLMFTLKVSLKPRVTFHDCQPYPSFTMAADTIKPWADSSFFCTDCENWVQQGNVPLWLESCELFRCSAEWWSLHREKPMCFLVCSSAAWGISKRPGSPEEQRA